MTAREEFVRRRANAGLWEMVSLHYLVIDQIFLDSRGEFSFAEIHQKVLLIPRIINNPAMLDNSLRIVLIVGQTLVGLEEVGMVKELTLEPGAADPIMQRRYVTTWSDDK